MLDPFDDYPVHQTAEPVAHTLQSDRNAYDRYFFHGFSTDGDLFFGAAMGVYPNIGVIDAAFSVARHGRQRSVHASARLPASRAETAVGPIRIEVVRPLDTLRVVVDAEDLGVRADLRFRAVTVAVEEPRHTLRAGSTVVLDATRLTQWGDWTGSLNVDGDEVALTGPVPGGRDRSWGIRPLADGAPGAPSGELPQVYWWWAPLRFADGCLHAGGQEDADGARPFGFASRLPLLGPEEQADEDRPRVDPPGSPSVEPLRRGDLTVAWRPGTRQAAHARLTTVAWDGGSEEIELEPLCRFAMCGLGYTSADWPHGRWHGELAVGSESWQLDELDWSDVHHLHVQQLVRARRGDDVGLGVLEQLALGPHPSGLVGFTDPAPG